MKAANFSFAIIMFWNLISVGIGALPNPNFCLKEKIDE